MPVTGITKDPEKLTMTISSQYRAKVERVWQVWADPRQLERWWGPPTYPATFVDHDLSPGGDVRYYMTGPEGDKHGGWWRVREVQAPNYLEFDDGFADDSGAPNPNMPSSVIRVRLQALPGGGTAMSIETTFSSAEAMAQLVAMGMDEGMSEAMGQIDALVA